MEMVLFTLRDHNTNKLRELNVYNFNGIHLDYKCKWIRHLLRLIDTRSPYLVYEYSPTGRRNMVLPRKL